MKEVHLNDLQAGTYLVPGKRSRYEYRVSKIIELSEQEKNLQGDGDFLICADRRRSLVNQKVHDGFFTILAGKDDKFKVTDSNEDEKS